MPKYKIIIPLLILVVMVFSYFNIKEKGLEGDFIKLGLSLPLSGINKELGQSVLEGANTYIQYINQNNGIQSKHIKIIYYDDKYEPYKTLQNTKRLIEEDQVFALFGFVGTPTTKKIIPFIGEIPFIAPYTGAEFLRQSNKNNIINFRSSYGEEIENIIHYLHTIKHINKFAIFYQNDDYGIAGYNATIKALGKEHLSLSGEGTYKRNTLSIKHALHEIKKSNPEVIIVIGAYKPSARFINSWRQSFSKNTLFAPISFVNANALIPELSGKKENIYFSLTVPSYDNKNLNIANEYRDLLHRYYPDKSPSYASFESFLATKAVVLALKEIKGDITQEKFLKQLRHLKSDALGKIPIFYKNSQLLNTVYLSIYKDGEFHLVDQGKR